MFMDRYISPEWEIFAVLTLILAFGVFLPLAGSWRRFLASGFPLYGAVLVVMALGFELGVMFHFEKMLHDFVFAPMGWWTSLANSAVYRFIAGSMPFVLWLAVLLLWFHDVRRERSRKGDAPPEEAGSSGVRRQ